MFRWREGVDSSELENGREQLFLDKRDRIPVEMDKKSGSLDGLDLSTSVMCTVYTLV
jgi:hypothetical protein